MQADKIQENAESGYYEDLAKDYLQKGIDAGAHAVGEVTALSVEVGAEAAEAAEAAGKAICTCLENVYVAFAHFASQYLVEAF